MASAEVEDCDGWTRSRVAKELDCSIATVRRHEGAGRLTPAMGGGDVRLHDPEQVRALAAELRTGNGAGNGAGAKRSAHPSHARWASAPPESDEDEDDDDDDEEDGQAVADPELAARVFEAFELGQDPITVVIHLRLDPDVVEALHDRYVRLSDREYVPRVSEQLASIVQRLHCAEQALAQVARGPEALGGYVAGLAAHVQALEHRLAAVEGWLQ